jgi:hypothetical protein
MTGMSAFSQQDVYNGEEYYDKHLKLKATSAMNA